MERKSGKARREMILLHDDARPRRAETTKETIFNFGRKVLTQPRVIYRLEFNRVICTLSRVSLFTTNERKSHSIEIITVYLVEKFD